MLITLHFYKQHDMFSVCAAKLCTQEQFANKFSNKLTPVKHKSHFMTLSISNNNVDDSFFFFFFTNPSVTLDEKIIDELEEAQLVLRRILLFACLWHTY